MGKFVLLYFKNITLDYVIDLFVLLKKFLIFEVLQTRVFREKIEVTSTIFRKGTQIILAAEVE